MRSQPVDVYVYIVQFKVDTNPIARRVIRNLNGRPVLKAITKSTHFIFHCCCCLSSAVLCGVQRYQFDSLVIMYQSFIIDFAFFFSDVTDKEHFSFVFYLYLC